MAKNSNINSSLPATQKYLDINEIRDETVIMRDGSLRAVLKVSSINFALKSEEEQMATVQSYVSFLNYLDHPVQVVVQSRKLNIDKYLAMIEKKEKKQTNELLKIQTAEYRQFITELVELGEIMSKDFYVVVPYAPGSSKKKSFFEKVGEVFSPLMMISLKDKMFRELKDELDKRLQTIEGGLNNMGLESERLTTQALIELYYKTYNPDVSEQQKLSNLDKLKVE